MVQALLDAGAAVDATNNDGWSALHFAARNARDEKPNSIETLRVLLAAGADPGLATAGGRAETPLALAGASQDAMELLRTAAVDHAAAAHAAWLARGGEF